MWLCLSYKQKLINWITTNDCRFVIKTCKDHNKEKWKTFFSLLFVSFSTASNSNKSTPACSPVLRKRSRSPTPQNQEGENMVEKGSDHSSDKSPSTPEQVVQRTYTVQSARSGGKNSKVSPALHLNPWLAEKPNCLKLWPRARMRPKMGQCRS